MSIGFSSDSTVQVPRLLVALGILVSLAGTVSFAASGEPSVSVILPASVVFGMGLYFQGARRYDVMDDKIRVVGVLGQRGFPFEKIHGFEDERPASFASRVQSLLTGAPLSSAIEVRRDRSFWSGQLNLCVRDHEDFIAAAREALATWRAARTSHRAP